MWKVLLGMSLLVFSFGVFAQVNTNGLTAAQTAELVIQAEKMKNATADPDAIVEVADKWINVGERFGKMMGGAAKEVGMAANDFLQTPVGLLTAGVIVFNYIGGPVIHVTVGMTVFFTILFVLLYMQRRAGKIDITYSPDKRTWYGTRQIDKYVRHDIDSDVAGWLMIGHLLNVIASMWIIFSW